jgi:phospholipid-translocating ATPase
LGTISFGVDSMEEVSSHLDKGLADEHDDLQSFAFTRKRGITSRVLECVIALSLCHNVTPTWDEQNVLSYQASSPDEIAIVKWTQLMGLSLIFRDLNTIRIRSNSGFEFEYEILETFPFTSESKRMGIVLRNTSTDKITFFLKGADVIMSKIVNYNHWLDEECSNMAREGLRTLVIGRKNIDAVKYLAFQKDFTAAKSMVLNRQDEMKQVVQRYLEKDVDLLGLTGVEDKLQDDIKITFELLRNAGIRIWMLTGDKIETAKCIAISSKLVTRSQPFHIISQLSRPDQIMEQMDAVSRQTDSCLIIDGESLQVILDHYPAEFISVAVRLPVVICCRCSPTQKAEIVRLVNLHTGKRTCAIGDGGNDVSMIQVSYH